MRGLPFDLRLSLRSLLRNRGLAAAAVLTLGLGIGSTTILFSILEAVLLRPWPYPGAERLVVPSSVQLATSERWSVAYADFEDWQKEGIFDGVAVYQISGIRPRVGRARRRLASGPARRAARSDDGAEARVEPLRIFPTAGSGPPRMCVASAFCSVQGSSSSGAPLEGGAHAHTIAVLEPHSVAPGHLHVGLPQQQWQRRREWAPDRDHAADRKRSDAGLARVDHQRGQ